MKDCLLKNTITMSINAKWATPCIPLHEAIIEIFFSDWYEKVKENREFCLDVPVYFYRKNTVLWDYKKNYPSLTEKSFEEKKKLLLSYFPDWSLFIKEWAPTGSLYGVLSFEWIKESSFVEEFFIKYKENFYIQQAELLFRYKQSDFLRTNQLFEKIRACDPENPFILLKYARFLWSVLFKQNQDNTILEKAIEHSQVALKSLWKDWEIFSFSYAWLWQLYSAKWDYKQAIKWYDKTISINLSQYLHKDEPYIWKASALTAMKKYRESAEIYTFLEKQGLSEKHKEDFRVYKTIATNSWYLKQKEKFRESFIKSLELLIQQEKSQLILTFSSEQINILNDVFLLWIFPLQNEFNSFINYYEPKVNHKIPKNSREIFLLWFFFLKQIAWDESIHFHNTRWLEKLCFLYLWSFIYE